VIENFVLGRRQADARTVSAWRFAGVGMLGIVVDGEACAAGEVAVDCVCGGAGC
jgi:hypothetical protein